LKLSAVDCLLRGWSNTLANWELVLVTWVQSFAVLVLVVAAVAIPLATIGFTLDWDPKSPERLVEQLVGHLPGLSSQLLLGLLACLALLTLAFLVYSYFQAGLFGVLHFADRQALPGPVRDRRLFRTFSLGNFSGWGGRFVWRFFWFYNLAGVLFSVALLLLVGWFALSVVAFDRWGGGAGWSLGCVGALPVFFLFFAMSLGISLAQADLPREESGPVQATRRGFDVLAQRPGAVLLLFLIFLLAGFGVALLFLPFSLGLTFGLADRPFAMLGLRAVLGLVQMVPSAALNVGLAAALVALVRGEASNRRHREVPAA